MVLIAPRGGLLAPHSMLSFSPSFSKMGQISFFNWSMDRESEYFFRRSQSLSLLVFLILFFFVAFLKNYFNQIDGSG